MDHDDRIGGFVKFLRRYRNGQALVGLLESKLAGESSEEHRHRCGWTDVELHHYDQDLRYLLSLYSQRFKGLKEEIERRLKSAEPRKEARQKPVRCFCQGTDLVEVRVLYRSHRRALTKVEFADGERRWVNPKDLLEPVEKS